MPAGFLSAMVHPDQSTINQMDQSKSGPTTSASHGEAIGTATLPKVSEQNKSKSSSPQIPGTSKSSGNKSRMFVEGKPSKSGGPRNPGTSAGIHPSSSRKQHERIQNVSPEGSGADLVRSDESMNSSLNTKDSRDLDKEVDPPNSEADQDVPTWMSRRHEAEVVSGVNAATIAATSSRPRPVRNKQPPWLERVNVTSDLMYRYKLPAGDLSDVLQKDLEALKIFGKQSTMVNDQLGMLYNELNFEGNNGITLNLDEGSSSNSSSGEENSKESEPRKTKKPVQSHQYSKMVMLYEENAPFPPEITSTVQKSAAENIYHKADDC
ncbi:Period circadian protein 2, partial [Orchesella cincta]